MKKKTRLFKQTITSENKTALKFILRAAAIQSAFYTGSCQWIEIIRQMLYFTGVCKN